MDILIFSRFCSSITSWSTQTPRSPQWLIWSHSTHSTSLRLRFRHSLHSLHSRHSHLPGGHPRHASELRSPRRALNEATASEPRGQGSPKDNAGDDPCEGRCCGCHRCHRCRWSPRPPVAHKSHLLGGWCAAHHGLWVKTRTSWANLAMNGSRMFKSNVSTCFSSLIFSGVPCWFSDVWNMNWTCQFRALPRANIQDPNVGTAWLGDSIALVAGNSVLIRHGWLEKNDVSKRETTGKSTDTVPTNSGIKKILRISIHMKTFP